MLTPKTLSKDPHLCFQIFEITRRIARFTSNTLSKASDVSHITSTFHDNLLSYLLPDFRSGALYEVDSHYAERLHMSLRELGYQGDLLPEISALNHFCPSKAKEETEECMAHAAQAVQAARRAIMHVLINPQKTNLDQQSSPQAPLCVDLLFIDPDTKQSNKQLTQKFSNICRCKTAPERMKFLLNFVADKNTPAYAAIRIVKTFDTVVSQHEVLLSAFSQHKKPLNNAEKLGIADIAEEIFRNQHKLPGKFGLFFVLSSAMNLEEMTAFLPQAPSDYTDGMLAKFLNHNKDMLQQKDANVRNKTSELVVKYGEGDSFGSLACNFPKAFHQAVLPYMTRYITDCFDGRNIPMKITLILEHFGQLMNTKTLGNILTAVESLDSVYKGKMQHLPKYIYNKCQRRVATYHDARIQKLHNK